MNRLSPLLLLALAPALQAQSTTTAATSGTVTTTSSVSTDASPTPPVSFESHANSHLSFQLADSMPHYSPPKPPPPPQPDVDIRDVDKPRNTIKRLPKYMVRAPKPPVFRDKDLYTSDGLGALGMKKYAGLNFGPLPWLNQATAKQMVEDDQRAANMADLEDTANAIGRGTKSDAAESEYIKKASSETYMRQDSSWTPASPGH